MAEYDGTCGMTEPLYRRLVDAGNGNIPNLAIARRLITEAATALLVAQSEIDRLQAENAALRQALIDRNVFIASRRHGTRSRRC